jgi:hypothetical protein
LPKSKPAFNSTDLDIRGFKTHISRIESSLAVFENKKYPQAITALQKIFKKIINITNAELNYSLEKFNQIQKKKIHLEEYDYKLFSGAIKVATKRILRFYNYYWGSVEFALHSVPWYFNIMLVKLLSTVLGKQKGEFFLVVFPMSGYTLEVVSVKDELKQQFDIGFDQLQDQINNIDNFFIFKIPPYLVLDPMSNFLVLHEIGHYFAKGRIKQKLIRETIKKIKHDIYEDFVKPLGSKEDWVISNSEWINNWMSEFISDCFSLAVCGPACLAAAKEFFILNTDLPSDVHPPPTLRKIILSCCLNCWVDKMKQPENYQRDIKKYFGNFITLEDHKYEKLFADLFKAIKEEAQSINLFYFNLILENIKKGFIQLGEEKLPIDILKNKDKWLFDYVLTLNCIWSVYFQKDKEQDLRGWRDKYNEILLKILEIEQFRDNWNLHKDLKDEDTCQ